ncbi:glycosyltransferase family 2 protein [Methanococcoides sp. AM1]|uniref:glycosyltransferase family 2 protein n=1 Tax=Methanococcoides sp. AM1 TaxID=1201011 RepID=UPI0010837089|nr:glycosyltransferase family 2 protein [Methanococcoides sp. AM1]
MPKISVCVPVYDRPKMLKQLIYSFLHQDYDNAELVLSDDSPNDSIQEVVETFNDSKIKYFKNKVNLGYSKNLLKSMQMAEGDYIVILGDDDLLLSNKTLSKYVEIFTNNPNVSYIYSNQIQFSNQLKIDYRYTFFKQDMYFKRGKESMERIWTTSIFIPGIGIRNNFNLSEFYPKEDILFPQVELVGHILNQYDSFGISDFLIAGRAHREQLGFYAIKNQRIKGGEKHGNIELFEIFNRLKQMYSFNYNDDFLANDLTNRSLLMLLKEKSIVGNKKVSYNYNNFCEMSSIARNSKKLKISYYIAIIMPSILINITRFIVLKLKMLINKESFLLSERQLKNIIKQKN